MSCPRLKLNPIHPIFFQFFILTQRKFSGREAAYTFEGSNISLWQQTMDNSELLLYHVEGKKSGVSH